MRKNLKPLGDRVLVRQLESGEKRIGNIIVPETATRGKNVFGEAILVGDGVYTQNGTIIPMSVKVGDMVMYKFDMGGDPIEIDGEKFLMFREHDLLMVEST